MNSEQALTALMECPLLKGKEVDLVIEKYGSPEAAAASLKLEIPKSYDYIEKNGIHLFHKNSIKYPCQLQVLKDAPPILTLQGQLIDKDQKAIAIIGTRQPSPEGISNAYQLAHDLAAEGYTIVSGLARGIDTAAHWGALKAGGRTIAVIGSGLANIYPHENANLAKAVAKQGAVISEFPIFTGPKRHQFPMRNRIISGLSLAVLMVEAPERSGAMLTVDLAEKQGVSCYTLPGRPNVMTTQGNTTLIHQKRAVLVESASQLIEHLATHSSSKISQCSPEKETIGVN